MNEDRLYQVAFSLLPILRASEAKALLEQVGSPALLFNNSDLQEAIQLAPQIRQVLNNGSLLRKAEEILLDCERYSIDLTFLGETEYPYRLAECEDAPLLLYRKGRANLNGHHIVSIVGTRKTTPRGKALTRQLVREIADRCPDTIIVSGLAYGIDITAHRAAMEYGLQTVAVLAHGLEVVYPEAHYHEAVEMQRDGCLIAELCPGTPAEPWRFLQRNRIVAGISDACIVVESGKQGGSLNTATRSFDYNRVVFAFPGRPDDEQSMGCNRLIKSLKATLIERADDVLIDLGWIQTVPKQKAQQELFVTLTPSQQRLYDLVRPEGTSLNELIAGSGMGAAVVMSETLKMQLDGLIESMPGNIYCRVK